MYKPFHGDVETLRETRDAIAGQMRSVHNQANSIRGRAESQKRELTAAEATAIDKLLARFETLESEHVAVVAELEDAENSTPRARLTEPTPIAGPMPGTVSRIASVAASQHRPGTFAALFAGRSIPDPYGGRFASLGEFALAVARGGRDSRLIQNATMTEGESSVSAGFLVPTQFLGNILDASLAREAVRPWCSVVPMTSHQAEAATFDYSDGTAGKRAGLQLNWGTEAATLAEQVAKARPLTLTARKANVYVRVSSELANDGLLFNQRLTEAMVAATATGLDNAFLRGTGTGMPIGVLSASQVLISVAKEGSQSGTFVLANAAKMIARLDPGSYSRAVWFVSPTAVSAIYTLSADVGVATASAVTADASGVLRIFGRPVVVTEACSALGTVGDVILADMSRYLVGLRAEGTVVVDPSKYFDSDELAFRLILRLDGQPMDAQATTLRDGTTTVSPFVTTVTR